MQLTFQSTPLTFLRSALRQVQNQEQTLELRLTDGMPDLGRILVTGGQTRLSSKQWRSGSVSITGGIQAWAIYAPEDGTLPQLVEGWIPFSGKWTLPEGSREGILDARITLRSLDGRVLSPRKLLLRASVALCAEALCPQEVSVCRPEEIPQDVCLLQNSYPVTLCREAGEKIFSLEETLEADLPEKLIACRVMPRLTEQSVAGDQLVLRGALDIRCLGCDAEGNFRCSSMTQPFAQLVGLEGEYDKDATASVTLDMGTWDWQREADGLSMRCEVLTQYRIQGNSLLNLAQDAYSHTTDLLTQTEGLELPLLLEYRQETMEAAGSLERNVSQVLDVSFLPDEPVTYREGEAMVAELPGQFQVLYLDDSGVAQSLTESWCGRISLPAGEECQLQVYPCLEGEVAASVRNGTLHMQAPLRLQARTYTKQCFPMVTGLELGQRKIQDPDRPSLILRRAGDNSLWDMAKGYGSTVEAIRQANGLTGEPDPKQMLLIPVM